jgi:hypothetical protein
MFRLALTADLLHSMPPNVMFEIDDLEKPWAFSKGFDFIFSRMVTGSFSNWKQYIERCFAYIPHHTPLSDS